MTREEASAVLGLSSDCDPAEARRAYLRLLKVHKPDRDPGGFQRIRAAYERLTSPGSALMMYFSAPEPPPTDRPQRAPEPDSPEQPAAPETQSSPTMSRTPDDTPDEAPWIDPTPPPSEPHPEPSEHELSRLIGIAQREGLAGNIELGEEVMAHARVLGARMGGALQVLRGDRAIAYQLTDELYRIHGRVDKTTWNALAKSIGDRDPAAFNVHLNHANWKMLTADREVMHTFAPMAASFFLLEDRPRTAPRPTSRPSRGWIGPLFLVLWFFARGLSGIGSNSTTPRPQPAEVMRLPLSSETQRLSTILRSLDRPEMADAVLEIGRLKDCGTLTTRVEALESEIDVQVAPTDLDNERSVVLNSARMQLVRAVHVACDSSRSAR